MAAFFRIVQERWQYGALNGEGARLYGGRWNAAGIPAVYFAESRALAALEILVHAPREALVLNWMVIEVEIPEAWIDTPSPDLLPDHWRNQPSSDSARDFGSKWLRERKNFALRVPSVIVPEEHGILANPLHPHMRQLKTGDPRTFTFDPRLANS